MLPELFRIRGIGAPVWAYGFMLATAFTVGLGMTVWLARKDAHAGGTVYKLGLCMIPSALLGGQLMMVIEAQGGSLRALLLHLSLRSGGYLGGFLMALAVSIILARVWRLPWPKTADAFAPGIALGYAIARLGCFLAGCCWGKPTSSSIGVRFTARAHELTGVPINSALLPTQLIEAGSSLLIFAALLWLRKRRAFNGQIILAYVLLYSVARFTVEFWRGDQRAWVLGLSTSQFILAIMVPLALMLYVRLHWAERARVFEGLMAT